MHQESLPSGLGNGVRERPLGHPPGFFGEEVPLPRRRQQFLGLAEVRFGVLGVHLVGHVIDDRPARLQRVLVLAGEFDRADKAALGQFEFTRRDHLGDGVRALDERDDVAGIEQPDLTLERGVLEFAAGPNREELGMQCPQEQTEHEVGNHDLSLVGIHFVP